jgi:hypothetical protein
MTPLPGAYVISEIVVPAVPFAWSVFLIGLALLLLFCVALSGRRR